MEPSRGRAHASPSPAGSTSSSSGATAGSAYETGRARVVALTSPRYPQLADRPLTFHNASTTFSLLPLSDTQPGSSRTYPRSAAVPSAPAPAPPRRASPSPSRRHHPSRASITSVASVAASAISSASRTSAASAASGGSGSAASTADSGSGASASDDAGSKADRPPRPASVSASSSTISSSEAKDQLTPLPEPYRRSSLRRDPSKRDKGGTGITPPSHITLPLSSFNASTFSPTPSTLAQHTEPRLPPSQASPPAGRRPQPSPTTPGLSELLAGPTVAEDYFSLQHSTTATSFEPSGVSRPATVAAAVRRPTYSPFRSYYGASSAQHRKSRSIDQELALSARRPASAPSTPAMSSLPPDGAGGAGGASCAGAGGSLEILAEAEHVGERRASIGSFDAVGDGAGGPVSSEVSRRASVPRSGASVRSSGSSEAPSDDGTFVGPTSRPPRLPVTHPRVRNSGVLAPHGSFTSRPRPMARASTSATDKSADGGRHPAAVTASSIRSPTDRAEGVDRSRSLRERSERGVDRPVSRARSRTADATERPTQAHAGSAESVRTLASAEAVTAASVGSDTPTALGSGSGSGSSSSRGPPSAYASSSSSKRTVVPAPDDDDLGRLRRAAAAGDQLASYRLGFWSGEATVNRHTLGRAEDVWGPATPSDTSSRRSSTRATLRSNRSNMSNRSSASQPSAAGPGPEGVGEASGAGAAAHLSPSPGGVAVAVHPRPHRRNSDLFAEAARLALADGASISLRKRSADAAVPARSTGYGRARAGSTAGALGSAAPLRRRSDDVSHGARHEPRASAAGTAAAAAAALARDVPPDVVDAVVEAVVDRRGSDGSDKTNASAPSTGTAGSAPSSAYAPTGRGSVDSVTASTAPSTAASRADPADKSGPARDDDAAVAVAARAEYAARTRADDDVSPLSRPPDGPPLPPRMSPRTGRGLPSDMVHRRRNTDAEEHTLEIALGIVARSSQ
ncbi:hypothetical protein Q5752_003233 [Cryptotrichosporon argae]